MRASICASEQGRADVRTQDAVGLGHIDQERSLYVQHHRVDQVDHKREVRRARHQLRRHFVGTLHKMI